MFPCIDWIYKRRRYSDERDGMWTFGEEEINKRVKEISEKLEDMVSERMERGRERESTEGVTKKRDGTVIVELPGAVKETIEVTLDDNEIDIEAETEDGQTIRRWVYLDEAPEEGTVKAKYSNGLMRIETKIGAVTKIEIE